MSGITSTRVNSRVRRITFVVVCAVLLGVGLAFALPAWTPDTGKPVTVSDTNKIVASTCRLGWVDNTSNDAGQIDR